MRPNIKIGGKQGYNMNPQFAVVSGAGGAAWTACATMALTVYPEPTTGNMLIIINTDDSSKSSPVFYTGTAWQACLA